MSTPIKNPRLNARTFSIRIGAVDADPVNGIEGNPGHELSMSLAYEGVDIKTGQLAGLHEIVFVQRGRSGESMELMMNDLSIAISRAIQHRDPETGEDLE